MLLEKQKRNLHWVWS